MATKTLTSGVKHMLLNHLISGENLVLLGVGGSSAWPIEAAPLDVDPVANTQLETEVFIPVVVKAAKVMPGGYNGLDKVEIQGVVFKTSNDPEVVIDENMNLLYISAVFDNTENDYPTADYRSFGLYQNCVVDPNYAGPSEPIWYLPSDITQAELFYLEHFQAVEAVKNVSENITILFRI